MPENENFIAGEFRLQPDARDHISCKPFDEFLAVIGARAVANVGPDLWRLVWSFLRRRFVN